MLYSCLRSLASPRGKANLTAYVCEQKLINENYVPILKMDQNTINSANCLVGNLLILMVLLNLLYFIIEYEQIIVGWISYLVIKNEKYNRTFLKIFNERCLIFFIVIFDNYFLKTIIAKDDRLLY